MCLCVKDGLARCTKPEDTGGRVCLLHCEKGPTATYGPTEGGFNGAGEVETEALELVLVYIVSERAPKRVWCVLWLWWTRCRPQRSVPLQPSLDSSAPSKALGPADTYGHVGTRFLRGSKRLILPVSPRQQNGGSTCANTLSFLRALMMRCS